MDYSDYSQQHSQPSPQRAWPPQLLTPAPPQSQSTPQSQSQQQQPFPSPVSPGPYYFPSQNHTPQQQPGGQQTSPTNDSRPTSSALSLNLSALSVASPTTLSPIGPHQAQSVPFHPHQLQSHHPIPHHPHHTHSHSHSSSSVLSVSPITPVSPPSFSPSHLSQPTFSFNFEDGLSTNAGGGGLSPTPDSLLAQRRPSTGSHSTSSSELVVEKSVPRKRSLTNTLPVSQPLALGHSMHHHSHSHSYTPTQPRQGGAHHTLPHPIITTTASSPPPPTSPTSPSSSHPSHSHSHSLSHSHSHSSLSHSSLSQAHSSQHPHPTQIDINAHPASPYEETDSAGARYTIIGDEGSEDEFGSASFGKFVFGFF
ncbi:hypothetical protein BDN67DRAFT_647266 [Paxillus ammoniavirescens]|nr:hypothetical protein BDN67DRAFT_647266 [Paxillus ammoniavirescens]